MSRQNIVIDNIIESTRVQGATYGQSQAKTRDTTDNTKVLEVLCAVPYIHDHIALKVVGVHVHAVRHGLIERLDRLHRQVPARTAGETHTHGEDMFQSGSCRGRDMGFISVTTHGKTSGGTQAC